MDISIWLYSNNCNYATNKHKYNPKYRQETRYNYVQNSGFWVSDCSPLLCYRFVTTALTAQIPTETLSQSHWLCFIRKERDSETGFSYFGARYYDSDVLTGWLSVDPMADKYPSLSPYAYCGWTRPTGVDEHRLIEFNIANNPVRLVDPDGEEIFASVQSNNVGVNANNTPVIKAKIFLPEGYTPNGEIRATTDFLFANYYCPLKLMSKHKNKRLASILKFSLF
ncbi:MAG: hypothetical protein J6V54_02110 [Bacteroidales bacterium]|nr:hypothetical protein [Bacteroidales bacterium]